MTKSTRQTAAAIGSMGARKVASKRQKPANALDTKTGLEVFKAFSP
jgi:hypothetical protein